MPVTAYPSINLVSGRFHQSSVEDEFKTLPVKFKTGMQEYDSPDGPFSGYSHHHFNIYLVKCEKIRYRINATSNIQFIQYNGHGILGFSDPPEKYIRLENRIEELDGILNVEETGAYYFSIGDMVESPVMSKSISNE